MHTGARIIPAAMRTATHARGSARMIPPMAAGIAAPIEAKRTESALMMARSARSGLPTARWCARGTWHGCARRCEARSSERRTASLTTPLVRASRQHGSARASRGGSKSNCRRAQDTRSGSFRVARPIDAPASPPGTRSSYSAEATLAQHPCDQPTQCDRRTAQTDRISPSPRELPKRHRILACYQLIIETRKHSTLTASASAAMGASCGRSTAKPTPLRNTARITIRK